MCGSAGLYRREVSRQKKGRCHWHERRAASFLRSFSISDKRKWLDEGLQRSFVQGFRTAPVLKLKKGLKEFEQFSQTLMVRMKGLEPPRR